MLLIAVVVALALFGFSHAAYQRGTQPLKQLKPFRQYEVVRVAERRNPNLYLLVLKYYVDYGHWEYRLAILEWSLIGEPESGQELWADGRGLHSGRVEKAA